MLLPRERFRRLDVAAGLRRVRLFATAVFERQFNTDGDNGLSDCDNHNYDNHDYDYINHDDNALMHWPLHVVDEYGLYLHKLDSVVEHLLVWLSLLVPDGRLSGLRRLRHRDHADELRIVGYNPESRHDYDEFGVLWDHDDDSSAEYILLLLMPAKWYKELFRAWGY
jgi:hypothetical protein